MYGRQNYTSELPAICENSNSSRASPIADNWGLHERNYSIHLAVTAFMLQ